jgi:C4-dicarboxylate-specific signal transduction histidine kinase
MTAGISFNLSDLKFFGAVSASISHEMKNVLAIINEMMGLLDDLGVLAASGKPFDVDRLRQIAARMRTQIERGNDIMRDLNRFAHSVDNEEQSLDLADLTDFVSGLARRRAALRNVDLETHSGPEPVHMISNPFALQHLLWVCLQQAVEMAGECSTIRLTVDRNENGPRIAFSPLAEMQKDAAETSADHRTKDLAERLGAEVSGNPSEKKLILSLPAGGRTEPANQME